MRRTAQVQVLATAGSSERAAHDPAEAEAEVSKGGKLKPVVDSMNTRVGLLLEDIVSVALGASVFDVFVSSGVDVSSGPSVSSGAAFFVVGASFGPGASSGVGVASTAAAVAANLTADSSLSQYVVCLAADFPIAHHLASVAAASSPHLVVTLAHPSAMELY